jgi:hypothetical protein
MSVRTEEVRVRYCDKCKIRNSKSLPISQCKKCNGDFCSEDIHGITIVGFPNRLNSYLCTQCRKELADQIRSIFIIYGIEIL